SRKALIPNWKSYSKGNTHLSPSPGCGGGGNEYRVFETNVANRAQKLLESENIKLGQVASDVLGLSDRLMLQALAAGEQDARKLAELSAIKCFLNHYNLTTCVAFPG